MRVAAKKVVGDDMKSGEAPVVSDHVRCVSGRRHGSKMILPK